MPASSRSKSAPHTMFWIATGFLLLVALTGGSSRIDVRSLLILRPVAALACALALITLRRRHFVGRSWLFLGLGGAASLILVHLVPLPPAIWHALPGRYEIAQTDVLVGLGDVWRPLTLTPMNAWQALASLIVPLAMLLLAVQLDRADLFRLVSIVILVGMLSGLFSLLQAIGTGSGVLDLYDIGIGQGVSGIFANRNHAALLLAMLFPMSAAWACRGDGDRTRNRLRAWVAAAGGAILVPLILVTGSRSGLILSLPALAGTFALVATSGGIGMMRRSRGMTIGIAGAGLAMLLVLGLMTLYFSRADAMVRLFDRATLYDPRLDNWQVSRELLLKYFPVGSGAGSFVEAYQIIEPTGQISPTYRNHAHNDILETGITFGLPGLALILAGVGLYCRRMLPLVFRRQRPSQAVTMARMAGIALLMMTAASLTDYPLRTPIMMCVLALSCLWLIEPGRRPDADAGRIGS